MMLDNSSWSPTMSWKSTELWNWQHRFQGGFLQ